MAMHVLCHCMLDYITYFFYFIGLTIKCLSSVSEESELSVKAVTKTGGPGCQISIPHRLGHLNAWW